MATTTPDNIDGIRARIESAWKNREDGIPEGTDEAVRATIDLLSQGDVRVAERSENGEWIVNHWVKQAILLHFKLNPFRPMKSGIFEYADKIDIRSGWSESGSRVVPGAIVREGAYVGPGSVLMPCFVNIGARIGAKTMIDTWSTVGSCAQIGENCHISGGVGIGGVLEPLQATPVIIEDNVFIGARSEVAEGVIVREGAVLAMGCYLGQSTRVYNAMTGEILLGEIPPRSVVVPGALTSRDGTHQTYALIIKKLRDEKTDARTALNSLLR